MLRAGGFVEYTPQEQIVFDEILKIIKNNYFQFGYTNIETPAVEKNSVLNSKSGTDASKQIYGLYGFAQGKDDIKDFSLHFDLTVPFARYVIDHKNELTFPFKRAQIQKVWRGERSQRGRFRELYQADIDVIWSNENDTSKYIYYDSEVIILGYLTLLKIFEKYGIEKNTQIHINNRNIIKGITNYIFGNDENKKIEFLNLLDGYFKMSFEKFDEGLNILGINEQKKKIIIELIDNENLLKKLEKYKNIINDETFTKGITELKSLIKNLILLSKYLNIDYEKSFIIDFKIVRGLDYYTGTVFETYFEDDYGIGSLYSGGRYDNLTSFIDPKSNYGGVGASIGASRLMTIIQEIGNTKFEKKTITDYLFINFSETYEEILNLASKFINEGKNIDIYPFADKIKKQFGYADKKGIKYVIILGEEENEKGIYKIKNMESGEEKIISGNNQ